MPLIKVRNKGNSILFIDSLGLTLRPSCGDDFSLVDEEKAKNDSQFMKCVILGSIETCPIDKAFRKKRAIKEKDESEKEENKKVKEEVEGYEIEEFVDPPEPKNSDAVVVVPGATGKNIKTSRMKSHKHSDIPMPKFIKQSDIRDMKDEDIDAESRGERDIDLSKVRD